eukprot:Lithocolla_globosa_v1_NODE_1247_length_2738_cov_9.295565.p1 type:complete len:412 gc:universal NODE_1247_length_2738_cov_9.295565:1336-2571(+)
MESLNLPCFFDLEHFFDPTSPFVFSKSFNGGNIKHEIVLEPYKNTPQQQALHKALAKILLGLMVAAMRTKIGAGPFVILERVEKRFSNITAIHFVRVNNQLVMASWFDDLNLPPFHPTCQAAYKHPLFNQLVPSKLNYMVHDIGLDFQNGGKVLISRKFQVGEVNVFGGSANPVALWHFHTFASPSIPKTHAKMTDLIQKLVEILLLNPKAEKQQLLSLSPLFNTDQSMASLKADLVILFKEGFLVDKSNHSPLPNPKQVEIFYPAFSLFFDPPKWQAFSKKCPLVLTLRDLIRSTYSSTVPNHIRPFFDTFWKRLTQEDNDADPLLYSFPGAWPQGTTIAKVRSKSTLLNDFMQGFVNYERGDALQIIIPLEHFSANFPQPERLEPNLIGPFVAKYCELNNYLPISTSKL